MTRLDERAAHGQAAHAPLAATLTTIGDSGWRDGTLATSYPLALLAVFWDHGRRTSRRGASCGAGNDDRWVGAVLGRRRRIRYRGSGGDAGTERVG